MSNQGELSRRGFLQKAAATGAAVHTFGVLGVPAKRTFKVGLIGCGGRGNGALKDCTAAAKQLGVDLQLVATADAFQDRALRTGTGRGVPKERCFWGFDAYRRLLETDVEVVLMATSPNFRPVHFEAAIAAGKNVFMEKPVAVDPPGARRVMAAGEEAQKKGLGVVAGTQRRHHRGYLRNQYAIANGAIGKIVGGVVYWCGGRLWFKERKQNEDDASYLVRNWVSFAEMSGDHIVEQHVHNLDIANWYIGHPPVAAIGFGGRARRQTGDQFDFFSVDFDYGDGCHIHSMCRQVTGCYNRVTEQFNGTHGVVHGGGKLNSDKEEKIEVPEFKTHDNAYVQEHIDLLSGIMEEKPLNEARNVAESTLTAIMGRISAYTGQLVRWSDLTKNEKSPFFNLRLSPAADDFEVGPVTAPADDVAAVPGK